MNGGVRDLTIQANEIANQFGMFVVDDILYHTPDSMGFRTTNINTCQQFIQLKEDTCHNWCPCKDHYNDRDSPLNDSYYDVTPYDSDEFPTGI